MDKEMKYSLITGGSRGIGYAIAKECARRGMNLLLVARNKEGLDSAVSQIMKEYNVDVKSLVVDLRDMEGPAKIWEWCSGNGYRVDILINNAGMAGTADFFNSTPDYNDERILVNVRAMVLLTRLFLPELDSHPNAFILNMGSLSGYYPLPYKSVYAASKAFVVSFSRAIGKELKERNIKVTVINPNGVRTNPDVNERINSHSRLLRKLFIMDAEKVARISIDTMLKGKPVVVPGFLNRLLVLLIRLLPSWIKQRWSERIFKKEIL